MRKLQPSAFGLPTSMKPMTAMGDRQWSIAEANIYELNVMHSFAFSPDQAR